MPAPPTIWLQRIAGPDLVSGLPGLELNQDTRIGRALDCDTCLPDPSVSRSHASIIHKDARWFIVDHHSTAGTWINTERIAPSVPIELRDADTIDIGPWRFRVGDDAAGSLTVTLDTTQAGQIESTITGRQLGAFSGLVATLTRCRSTNELAKEAIRAAIDGTVYQRGIVLKPADESSTSAEVIASHLIDDDGHEVLFSRERFRPSSRLIRRAMTGQTAFYARSPGDDQTLDHAMSLVSDAMGSALCVPVQAQRGIGALLYLDTPSNPDRIGDPAAYCENIASLFAYALASRANAELAERQRAMQIEFELAENMRAMLNRHQPIRSGRCRFAHHAEPGMFVSADFFSIIEHDDRCVDIIFGDGAGHGMGASILSTTVHAYLAALLGAGAEISLAAQSANRFVASRATQGRFVSLVIMRLSPDGDAALIDAGHAHWMRVDRSGASPSVIRTDRAANPPLGIDPHATFHPQAFRLVPGDRVVIYSDGITEQTSPDGLQFGIERLADILRDSPDCHTDTERVAQALRAFAAGSLIEDDASIASIEILSTEPN